MIAAPDRTPLTRDLFDRPVPDVTPDLLGRVLVRATTDGPIEPRRPGTHGTARRPA
ncbi:hypothetical protein ACF07B_06545 [Streptomyces sp. NPDC015532]|uniref:hypothetical protein n=1 Tax=Streptomyces sp. NPDC015532 TaxID=3364960 RepID=UPI0036F5A66B